jgi:hypothetical protein
VLCRTHSTPQWNRRRPTLDVHCPCPDGPRRGGNETNPPAGTAELELVRCPANTLDSTDRGSCARADGTGSDATVGGAEHGAILLQLTPGRLLQAENAMDCALQLCGRAHT